MEPIEIMKRNERYINGYENFPSKLSKRAKTLCYK